MNLNTVSLSDFREYDCLDLNKFKQICLIINYFLPK